MPLNPAGAVEQARILHGYHGPERDQLDVVRRYWKGRQRLPVVLDAADSRRQVRAMARASRVNVLPIVVNSLVQSAFVDGFRANGTGDDLEVWWAWQANHLDARQSGIHRATAGFGAAYAVVTDGEINGEAMPVIRGVSPRSMTALYGEDPDWPIWTLERVGNGRWILGDDEAFYHLDRNDRDEFIFLETREHGAPVCPVVRYLDEDDLDVDDEVDQLQGEEDTVTTGQVAPLMPIQDQIDLTTFGLQVAQHYGAFKQRWVIGWAAESEEQALKAKASDLWAWDKKPEDMKVGEFSQTDLKGYIESREASLRHASTLSQTPVHELTGALVNLSAEALAAAEAGKDRKVNERQTLWGESHEQTLWLVGHLMGIDVPDTAEVVWRDTSARSFAATVDGLGKVAAQLKVPVEALWERIPGVTKQDVERWKTAGAAEPDPVENT